MALEGDCPCLVLTGNLYPNDVIPTRSEVLETSIIIVREDTFTVAKKMENLLIRHKMRDAVKVRQSAGAGGPAPEAGRPAPEPGPVAKKARNTAGGPGLAQPPPAHGPAARGGLGLATPRRGASPGTSR